MSSKDHEPFDLAGANFKIHQLEGFEKDNVCNAFSGYVAGVLGKINDGKEATVYLCEATQEIRDAGIVDKAWLAAKIYRPRKFRNFDNDHGYRNFGKMRDRRLAKSMRGKSKKGERAFHNHWIDSEWKTLNELYELGIRVPKPYLISADGVLMEYVGNTDGPAPRLVNCRLDNLTATRVLANILRDLRQMIEHDIVHGDFSAYNLLYDGDQHWVIDVPQAVDARVTPEAYALFQRDLINIGKYFERYGLEVPVDEMMRRYF